MNLSLKFLIIVALLPSSLLAQNTLQDSIRKNNEILRAVINAKEKEIVNYYYLYNPGETFSYADTSLVGFHQYDPTRKRKIDFLTTGNGASSATDIKYKSKYYRGFNSGFEAYDVYKLSLDNYKIYEADRSFSDLFFSPLAGQDNFITSAKYAQPFKDGINLSLDYQRLNYLGFYQNQESKSTNFGISINYKNKNNRFGFTISHISNVNEEDHNGGVDTSTFSGAFLNNRKNVAVLLSDANTRNQEKILDFRTFFNLAKDSSNWNIQLNLGITNSNSYFKFSDKVVSNENDNLFYGDFITDTRGLRRYYKVKTFSLSPGILIKNKHNIRLWSNLIYDRNSIDLEGSDELINDVTLSSKINISLDSALIVKGNFDLGLGDNAGNILLSGKIITTWKENIKLTGIATINRTNPSLIENQLYSNSQYLYNNNFEKPFATDLEGKIYFDKLRLSIGFTQSTIANAIYWDENQKPVQYDENYLATSIQVAQSLKINKFGLDLDAVYQVFNENIYHLPSYFIKPNLHYTTKLFDGKLELRIGAESRLLAAHQSKIYQPLTGNFYNVNQEVDFYPITDVYITAKIQKFRVFFKFENFTDYFSSQIYYQTLFQPQNDKNFRLGVRWTLFD